ncbi:S1C family serine protease [bacterium]|nr:S1C family serine protease [bacterium]
MAQEMMLEKLSEELSSITRKVSESIVFVQSRRSASSGIVWEKNTIVTADHLLPRQDEVHIQIPSGETTTALVAGRDSSTDLALLKTTTEFKAVEKETSPFEAGQLAISIGRANRGRLLAVLGIVSGSDGPYRNWRGGTLDRFIRLDVSPFPGFSGSALVLPNGKVGGMNTAAFSRHFGLTVPASNIDRLVERLSKKGSIGKPYLGLMMQPVRIPKQLQEQSRTEIGLLVMGTEEASPAEEAGIILGDIIVRLNEKNVNSLDEIFDALNAESIGHELKLAVLRGGKVEELGIKVGERPIRQKG